MQNWLQDWIGGEKSCLIPFNCDYPVAFIYHHIATAERPSRWFLQLRSTMYRIPCSAPPSARHGICGATALEARAMAFSGASILRLTRAGECQRRRAETDQPIVVKPTRRSYPDTPAWVTNKLHHAGTHQISGLVERPFYNSHGPFCSCCRSFQSYLLFLSAELRSHLLSYQHT